MLYQEGEKLKELKDTIDSIPTLSKLHPSYFVLSKDEKQKFEAPIRKLFRELNRTLYDTLLSNESEDEKTVKVYTVVEKIILFLDRNFKRDIIEFFYEEKLSFYEKMFVILVRDQLCVRYKEYKQTLLKIPKQYTDMYNAYKAEVFKYPRINDFISNFKELNDDLLNKPLYGCTKTYLTHFLELILEQISGCVKDECKKCAEDESYSNYYASRLRYLIYLLKKEFKLDTVSDK